MEKYFYSEGRCFILLSESCHIIWASRNFVKQKRKTTKNMTSFQVISIFLSKTKLRMLAFTLDDFGPCILDIIEDKINFDSEPDIQFYVQKNFIKISSKR